MTIKKNSGIVSRIAVCVIPGCGWRNENLHNATNAARYHVEKTGHRVSVEVSKNISYSKVA